MTSHSYDIRKSIALVGLMGAGKTSVGKRLAPLLGMPFFDADTEIETAAEMSIVDIFEAYGEKEFRRLEHRVIQRLLVQEPCVIATGGGAYVQDVTRETLEAGAITVWLNAEVATLVERTKGRGHRPLLNNGNHAEVLRDLKTKRDPYYALARVHFETHGKTDEALTAEALLETLKGHL